MPLPRPLPAKRGSLAAAQELMRERTLDCVRTMNDTAGAGLEPPTPIRTIRHSLRSDT